MYNTVKTQYLESEKYTVFSRPLIAVKPTQEQIQKRVETRRSNGKEERELSEIEGNLRRTRRAISDIALSNKWQYFVTLTFNPEKVNSYDYQEVTAKLSQMLKNWRKRYAPDMVYIVVPERHKSGRWHFHMLVSNIEGISLEESGKRDKKGRAIYNIGEYKLGFTTATEVHNSEATSRYITKYITKEVLEIAKDKKRYWVSRNAKRPKKEKGLLDESQIDDIKSISSAHYEYNIAIGDDRQINIRQYIVTEIV